MWARKAFKMAVRPLSALSLLVPVFGVLGAVAVACVVAAPAFAAGDANEAVCPNEASSGFRSYLPDCRAYELVSPAIKGGAHR
jgi:hypothetical protein